MQRKPGTLTTLESQILRSALILAAAGGAEFYGFQLAKQMKEHHGALFRTAYGPLYKALDRMTDHGLLETRWEDPDVAAAERRPRRCFYRVTAQGQRALEPVPGAAPAREGEAPA